MEGNMKVNLAGTQLIEKQPKGMLQTIIAKIIGKKKLEKEVVTQLQCLEGMYNVFKELGQENLVRLEVNGTTVYEDEEHKPTDLYDAVQLALKANQEEAYHIEMVLEPKDGGEDDYIEVNMYQEHKEGERPLTIDVYIEDMSSEEMTSFLKQVEEKITLKFGVEDIDIDVEEDEEDEESEEESNEESESEDSEEEK